MPDAKLQAERVQLRRQMRKNRAKRARQPSRTARRAALLRLSPREPKGAQTYFLRGLRRLIGEMERLTERELLPVLAELDPDAATPLEPERTDAVDDRVARRLRFLEVAFTELVEESEISPLVDATGRRIAEHNRRELRRVLDLAITSTGERGLETLVAGFRDRNIRLVKSVAFDQLKKLEELVETSTAGQFRVEVLREQIQHTFDVSRSRAALIARDQTLKANAQLSQLRQQNAGVTQYIWVTSRDERVRSAHADLDGTVQSWLAPPVVSDDGRTGHPGEDYQCRCVAVPVIDRELSGEG